LAFNSPAGISPKLVDTSNISPAAIRRATVIEPQMFSITNHISDGSAGFAEYR
jgi:hypothetical protein